MAPPAPKRQEADDPSRRVVQTETGRVVEKAPEKAHLGERNQVVDRETVSKDRAIRMGQSRAKGRNPQERAPLEPARGRADAKAPALSQLGVPIIPKGQLARPTAPEWRGADAASASDYVKGIKEGDQTALNTREYVFYGYFQRIRESLDRAWNSSLKLQLGRLYRNGRRLASDMDHQTRVLVTLNAAGQVIRVQIIEESGTRDLDEAAIRAFNQAGPFPNPPKGLVDASGEIKIRWDFVLRS